MNHLFKYIVVLELCLLKKATEKARVLRQGFHLKTRKVYSSLKMSISGVSARTFIGFGWLKRQNLSL